MSELLPGHPGLLYIFAPNPQIFFLATLGCGSQNKPRCWEHIQHIALSITCWCKDVRRLHRDSFLSLVRVHGTMFGDMVTSNKYDCWRVRMTLRPHNTHSARFGCLRHPPKLCHPSEPAPGGPSGGNPACPGALGCYPPPLAGKILVAPGQLGND